MKKHTTILILLLFFITVQLIFAIEYCDGQYHQITAELLIPDNHLLIIDYSSTPYPGTHVELAGRPNYTDSVNLHTFGYSHATLSNISIYPGSYISGNSNVDVYSIFGSVELNIEQNSTLNIFSGTLIDSTLEGGYGLFLRDSGTVTLYGVFNYDYGELPIGTPSEYTPSGRIIGTLSDGGEINLDYWIYSETAKIILAPPIPEPATLSLLALGGLLLRKRK